MTYSEKKYTNLKTAKQKLEPNGNESRVLKNKRDKIESSLKDYIKNSNLNYQESIYNLETKIEDHSDFTTAVYSLTRAINKTLDVLNLEKSEKKG